MSAIYITLKREFYDVFSECVSNEWYGNSSHMLDVNSPDFGCNTFRMDSERVFVICAEAGDAGDEEIQTNDMCVLCVDSDGFNYGCDKITLLV